MYILFTYIYIFICTPVSPSRRDDPRFPRIKGTKLAQVQDSQESKISRELSCKLLTKFIKSWDSCQNGLPVIEWALMLSLLPVWTDLLFFLFVSFLRWAGRGTSEQVWHLLSAWFGVRGSEHWKWGQGFVANLVEKSSAAQSGRFKVHTPCSSNTSSTSSQSVWGRQLFLYVWVVRLLTCVCHEQQWFAVVFKYWPTDWIARGCGLTFWPAIFAVTLHMDGGAQASGSELALCRLRPFPFYFSVFACPARSWCLLVLGIAGESVGRLWSVFFCILSTWILRNLRPAHEFYAHHFTQIAEAQNSQGQSAQNLHNPTAHDFFGTIKPWHSAKHLGILKFKYACYTCIFYMFMICMYIFMYTHFLMYTHFFICKDMFTVYLFIYLFIYTCRCLNT